MEQKMSMVEESVQPEGRDGTRGGKVLCVKSY